jgi:hypothetical protein
MMRPTFMRFRTRSPRAPSSVCRVCLVGLCVAAIVSGGCAERTVKANAKKFPWGTTASARPIVPKTVSYVEDQADDVSREFGLEVAPPPSPLIVVNSAPARPRVVASPAGPNSPAKFEPPQIVPQLTEQETAAAQQQTNLSLSIAERNIGSTQGRTLNPAQSDLVSKVRSFISEAREAAHIGDWTRASSAAKKAEVLSEELARSL